MNPVAMPSRSERRMQRTPIGPTGAAIENPMTSPFRKSIVPMPLGSMAGSPAEPQRNFGPLPMLPPFCAAPSAGQGASSGMEKRPFAELGVSPEVLKAVDKLGYEEASPIQTAVIPVVLQARDEVGMSATGSGKTAAFAIPAIELSKASVHKVQCLILCPTRELAVQVAEETGKLLLFKRGLHVVPIYGGQSYERQFRALAAGVQIVIGTPGRVMDHMERGTLKLDGLRVAVLDEADRMLDMGFRDDIERILSAAPAERQTLFFS